ncbi:hypothetical protein TRFO_18970 [Tritrichomonas foetus]|uniref:Uncharacterized protein n=1 Tax=Tritrichomonas foetus TaxID=1144522 RepID=A0A1J4KQ19_9EUKA|nr:hypothetical protein TRFO_18970 [Tritrichomonas foetus]|eukprot:OHT11525.1 hypothetical protein TRFO_18970 [Tritrichomonas foetus]
MKGFVCKCAECKAQDDTKETFVPALCAEEPPEDCCCGCCCGYEEEEGHEHHCHCHGGCGGHGSCDGHGGCCGGHCHDHH